jgi:wyosine [tRNA(Phe)-imidazoG37] synthetase (radical SAM superfamily)
MSFYEPEDIIKSVNFKIEQARIKSEPIDYLTFVSDGEPTLDYSLGKEIEALKSSGKKVAVITNASLIWREDVRKDLQKSDWISLKIDAISEHIWRKVDRPHKSLNLNSIN